MKKNTTRVRPKKRTATTKPNKYDRLARRLIEKYEKKRAKYYRETRKATKRNDIEGQLVYGVYQLAYTEMQVDLERLFKL